MEASLLTGLADMLKATGPYGVASLFIFMWYKEKSAHDETRIDQLSNTREDVKTISDALNGSASAINNLTDVIKAGAGK